jgi:hypothetical protein
MNKPNVNNFLPPCLFVWDIHDHLFSSNFRSIATNRSSVAAMRDTMMARGSKVDVPDIGDTRNVDGFQTGN